MSLLHDQGSECLGRVLHKMPALKNIELPLAPHVVSCIPLFLRLFLNVGQEG